MDAGPVKRKYKTTYRVQRESPIPSTNPKRSPTISKGIHEEPQWIGKAISHTISLSKPALASTRSSHNIQPFEWWPNSRQR